MPESGGEYHFLARVFHPRLGFLAGWTSLLAGFTAPIAVSALVLGSYLAPGSERAQAWIGTAVIAAAVLLHGVRLRPGALVQNLAVGLKLAMLAGLVVFGALRIAGGEASSGVAPAFQPPFSIGAFAVTLVWVSFAYSGWNAAIYVAGEVRDPARMLPRALIGATLLVTVVYLAVNAVFLHSTDVALLAGRPDVAAVAAEALGGERLRRAVEVLITIALFTSVCAMVMAGPRVYARMAEDGLFPRVFAARAEVPRAAVLLQGALACLVLWVAELATLLGYVGFTLGLSSAATVTALLVLRRREGPERVPIPGHPVVPLVFIVTVLASSGFMAAREPAQALVGVATVLTGWPVYELLRRRRDRRGETAGTRTRTGS
jgi:APA family basic amino acid/polyamine antiporter